MALKDLLAFVDQALETDFLRKAYDPQKGREAFIKKLDTTRAKFLATEPPRGRKDFNVGNNVVAFSPTLNGRRIAIGDEGDKPLYIPAERFADFLDKLKEEVRAGSLDETLKAASEAEGSAEPRAPRRASTSEGGSGRTWSEERRRKFQESIAARKAAKGR